MKKIVSLIILVLLSGFAFNAYALSDKEFCKIKKKQYKIIQKQLKKEGWKVLTSTLTLDAALMKCYRADCENNKVITAFMKMCESLNECKADALDIELMMYAQDAKFHVRDYVIEMFNNVCNASTDIEFYRFCAIYEYFVRSEIEGEFEFILDLQKENGAGKSYLALYIVNEEKAVKARLRAIQRALEETKLAQEYADKVANFTKEKIYNH